MEVSGYACEYPVTLMYISIFVNSYVKNKKTIYLDFEVDRLTNSIENAISGEVFDTLIVKLTDGKEIKKNEWAFNWYNEIKDRK